MGRDDQLNIRVSESEKAAFEEYVEETHEYKSVAQMMRQLAHMEIKDGGQSRSIDPDQMRTILNETIQPLTNQINDLDERLTDLSSQVSDDDEIDRLTRNIYHNLPEHESPDELVDLFEYEQSVEDAADDLSVARAITTAPAWAAYFDVSESDARTACAQLKRYYPDARHFDEKWEQPGGGVVEAPERRYYKTNE